MLCVLLWGRIHIHSEYRVGLGGLYLLEGGGGYYFIIIFVLFIFIIIYYAALLCVVYKYTYKYIEKIRDMYPIVTSSEKWVKKRFLIPMAASVSVSTFKSRKLFHLWTMLTLSLSISRSSCLSVDNRPVVSLSSLRIDFIVLTLVYFDVKLILAHTLIILMTSQWGCLSYIVSGIFNIWLLNTQNAFMSHFVQALLIILHPLQLSLFSFSPSLSVFFSLNTWNTLLYEVILQHALSVSYNIPPVTHLFIYFTKTFCYMLTIFEGISYQIRLKTTEVDPCKSLCHRK